jgi:NAD-dependent dihydropyrimidine dehydrogenase PreA subunit
MSFQPDLIQYPSSKGADAMKADLFFAPDPQLAVAPPPEIFDQEVDNDKEVEEFDLELSFKEFDDFFATVCDTIPVVPTPSVVTHSTESAYEVSSQYSSDFTLSEYSIPSEIESRDSVNDGLYSTHASVYSSALSDFTQSIPAPSPAKAVAVQESTVALSAAVHVVPGEARKAHGPVKPFKCPHCRFCESECQDFIIGSFLLLASARKHNLKTHIATHNKEQSKCFACSTCGRGFTRKHDLRRHRVTIHGETMFSSSSVSSISKPSFDRMPDQPSPHCITLNGDPTPVLPPCPDPLLNFDAVVGVPENIIAWLKGV